MAGTWETTGASSLGGFVDIHCHGGAGHEFGGPHSRDAAAHHRQSGAAHLLASLVSASPSVLAQQVAVLAPLVADGTISGIHLEGPFISSSHCGAHDPSALLDPDPAVVELLVAVAEAAGAPGAVRQMTFAPELPGAADLIRTLVDLGVRPAVGHTAADSTLVARTLTSIAEAQDAPALVTHLFNAMPQMHHRAGGPVSAALAAAARGDALLELIADGVHVAPDVVRMLFETVGPDAVALVSDAMAATGLGDGRYALGALEVVVEAGTARTSATGAIAGSTSTLADCVHWAVEVAGVDAADVRTSATTTPARAVGIARRV